MQVDRKFNSIEATGLGQRHVDRVKFSGIQAALVHSLVILYPLTEFAADAAAELASAVPWWVQAVVVHLAPRVWEYRFI